MTPVEFINANETANVDLHLAKTELTTSGETPKDPEIALFHQRVDKVDAWMRSPRFQLLSRPYSASDVVKLQGGNDIVAANLCTTISNSQSQPAKFYKLLQKLKKEKKCSHTFGALDPVQVVQMAEAGLTSIYVSGWQSSSTASTSNEPGPDLADYPMDTVPNKVDQLHRAQLFHDRKQYEKRMRAVGTSGGNDEALAKWREENPAVDYVLPIVADADTGHGGLTAVMRLTKMFIEAGASGIHLEDQKPGTKKCGHMGGKVLVSTEEHCQRLIAARLQADIMGSELLIVARTDAEAATLLDNNIDGRDHAFIKGVTVEGLESLIECVKRGGNSEEWKQKAQMKTFVEVVKEAILSKGLGEDKVKEWMEKVYDLGGWSQMRKVAVEMLGLSSEQDLPFFDSEAARTTEGFYQVQGGVKFCSQRAKAFGRLADLLWMETAKPGVAQAKAFSDDVKSALGNEVMFAYNQSPSFNWDVSGLSDAEIKDIINELAQMGFVWQFITLAGFHMNAVGITHLARKYKEEGMLAYVRDVQRVERTDDVSTLLHQKWSGSELVDRMTQIIQGGKGSTGIMSGGVTEKQFGGK